MENENIVFEISLLISKFLAGDIEPDELERLDHWKNESAHHAQLFDRICSGEKVKEKIAFYRDCDSENALSAFMIEKRKWEQKARPVKKGSRRMLLWGVNVAAVAVMGVVVWMMWKQDVKNENDFVVAPQQEDNSVVKLIAGSGEVFDLDTLRQIDGEMVSARNENGELVFSSKDSKANTALFNTIEVPQGAEYELVLTDGTKVFLNSETLFRFPENFAKKGAREVYLSGEAYFRVAKDSLRPFVVKTDFTYTKVLGTVFNVMAYKGALVQQTTLVEGRVKVGSPVTNEEVELIPGMQASYDKNTRNIEKHKVDVSYYVAWKEGIFAFRENRLEDVMGILSRWYGFNFSFLDAKMRDYVYTGKVGRHTDLNSVLEHFRMTGEMDFDVNGKDVIIKPKK